MQESEVLFSILPGVAGDVAEITLNRPQALNALTLTMCQQIHDKLQRWQEDSSIKAVIIRGRGERAFCAGGDVRALHSSKNNIEPALQFFRHEYKMNLAIFHFTKPYIALLDGLTLGGGAGVSIHGSHQVATQKFSFAMPETAIGYFPDIGARYFLNRCPGEIGTYLGLTGNRISVADAYASGLINCFVAEESLEKIVAELCATQFGSEPMDTVSSLLATYQIALPATELLQHKKIIDACFAKASVEEILSALAGVESEWAEKTLALLQRRSPTALKVTLNALRRAQGLSFDEIMQMDFNLAHEFMHCHDFFEGVRAVLVDKDQSPAWRPKELAAVTEAMVAKFFVEQQRL